MKRFIQGEHRGQGTLLPESLDDYVALSYFICFYLFKSLKGFELGSATKFFQSLDFLFECVVWQVFILFVILVP